MRSSCKIFRRVLSDLKSTNSLKKKSSFLVEGKRLIKEALKSGCHLQYILFSRKNDVEDLKSELPKLGAQLYKMPYEEMQLWSDLTTNPGIMGNHLHSNIRYDFQ